MFALKIEMDVTILGNPEIGNDKEPSKRATECDAAFDSRR